MSTTWLFFYLDLQYIYTSILKFYSITGYEETFSKKQKTNKQTKNKQTNKHGADYSTNIANI